MAEERAWELSTRLVKQRTAFDEQHSGVAGALWKRRGKLVYLLAIGPALRSVWC